MIRSLRITALLVVVSTFCTQATAQNLPPHKAGEVLIGYRPDSSLSQRASALALVNGASLKSKGRVALATQTDLSIDHIAVSLPVSKAIDLLQDHPAIAFVEPNYLLRTAATSNDPSYLNGSLWGVYGNDVPVCGPTGTTNSFGSDAEEAWQLGFTGSNQVFVGVIDEGLQPNHPDLAGNIWVNPYDAPDGIDNDGNGYIDDTNGWDFYNRDNTVFDALDGDTHGTHVAGTIGARGGDGLGIAGVSWNVTMISTKFLGPQGGYTSDAIAAIDYLRDLKTRHGLKIIASNNSWGGGGYSSALHTAILRAAKQGILFVAAAGNSGLNNDTTANYPANYSTLQGTAIEAPATYEAVISVAAISSTGARASFSNYGATTVDIGAPGVGILSTVPNSSYASYSGTSMATPHVSGAVALYSAAFPTATAQQIRTAILGAAKPTTSLAGLTVTGGRLSLEGLFGAPPPQQPVRDGAVTAISAASTVRPGRSTSVSITIANQGNQTETFTVSLGATSGLVGAARAVTLAAGASAVVGITWIAPTFRTTATLTGRVAALSGETDLADNARSRSITVR
ncbi:MAG: S8 family serine peptidase [Pseudomonadota bacterium]|jgi:subtilisin family serine protease